MKSLYSIFRRVCNPQLGNFLSGDIVVKDPTNGQNYNRDSCVSNNLTNLTDSTGFFEIGSICGNGHDCEVTLVNPDSSTINAIVDKADNSSQRGTASQRPGIDKSNAADLASNSQPAANYVDDCSSNTRCARVFHDYGDNFAGHHRHPNEKLLRCCRGQDSANWSARASAEFAVSGGTAFQLYPVSGREEGDPDAHAAPSRVVPAFAVRCWPPNA